MKILNLLFAAILLVSNAAAEIVDESECGCEQPTLQHSDCTYEFICERTASVGSPSAGSKTEIARVISNCRNCFGNPCDPGLLKPKICTYAISQGYSTSFSLSGSVAAEWDWLVFEVTATGGVESGSSQSITISCSGSVTAQPCSTVNALLKAENYQGKTIEVAFSYNLTKVEHGPTPNCTEGSIKGMWTCSTGSGMVTFDSVTVLCDDQITGASLCPSGPPQ
jgi:hypothetical protein